MLLIFISFFKFDPCRLLQKVTSLLWVQITFLAVEVIGIVLLFLKWILFTISGIGKKGEWKEASCKLNGVRHLSITSLVYLFSSLLFNSFSFFATNCHTPQMTARRWQMNIDNNNRKTNYASNKLSKFHFFFCTQIFCFKLGRYI